VQRGKESGETCVPQVLNEVSRAVKQVLALGKDSRCLCRSDAGDSLSILSSAISGCGIRHVGPSFPASWRSRLSGYESCPICGRHIIGQQICRFLGLRTPNNAITKHTLMRRQDFVASTSQQSYQ
jgi:hypothetical protein